MYIGEGDVYICVRPESFLTIKKIIYDQLDELNGPLSFNLILQNRFGQPAARYQIGILWIAEKQ